MPQQGEKGVIEGIKGIIRISMKLKVPEGEKRYSICLPVSRSLSFFLFAYLSVCPLSVYLFVCLCLSRMEAEWSKV